MGQTPDSFQLDKYNGKRNITLSKEFRNRKATERAEIEKQQKEPKSTPNT
jgi:hypothetical protein